MCQIYEPGQTARPYREDPEKVTKVMEMIIRTQDSAWNDLQVVLDTLVTYDDKVYCWQKQGRRQKRFIHRGHRAVSVDVHLTSTDPTSDPNVVPEQDPLTKYQRLVWNET